jgi:hypothetical protein
VKEHEKLVALFTELLRPYGIPPTPDHEVLHEAAKQAGWTPPSSEPQHRQQAAGRGRAIQRAEAQAHRRVLVAHLFKKLSPALRAKPSSQGTALAIIRQLKKLPFDRAPPMTERTIKEDILYMKKNWYFGI